MRRSAEVGCRAKMFIWADSCGQTLALLATFLGIGVLVNVLIVYIVFLVLGEHKQNQEHRPRPGD